MKEKILKCGCHKINTKGELFSRFIQRSEKGIAGFITEKTNSWNKLKLTKTKNGYLQAYIHKKSIRLNRLVAITFIDNPNNMPDVLHKDDNKLNNNIENLYWGNAKLNARDRIRNGNNCFGEKNGNAKLSDKKVIEIRQLRKETKMSLNDIAKKYNVSKKLILLVNQNKIWKHVK